MPIWPMPRTPIGLKLMSFSSTKVTSNAADVGVDGNVVVGEIAVDEAAPAWIEHAFLEQRLADSPDDASLRLRARRLGVYQPPNSVRGDDARHADTSECGVDAHFGEYRAERAQGDSDGRNFVPVTEF